MKTKEHQKSNYKIEGEFLGFILYSQTNGRAKAQKRSPGEN